MSFIPWTGPISFSNIRTALGQSSSLPTGMGDLYNSSIFAPTTGAVSIAEVRGITTNPIFQSFSPETQSNASGIFSVKLVNSAYTGPVLNLRRSSDNVSNDFYSDYAGNLKMADGTNYADWSNGTIRVMTWYDQSGNARHANATSASGGNPPLFVTEPTGTGKYCIYFPNSNASASQYYGFTTPILSTRSVICNYYTLTKASSWQQFLTQNNTEVLQLRITNVNQIIGGGNEFLNSTAFTVFNGTYSSTSPFIQNTINTWHTFACCRTTTGNANFVHIGHLTVTVSSGTLQSRSFNGYMTDLYTFSNQLSLIPIPSSSNIPEFQTYYKNNHIPFWRNGLIGCYLAEKFSSNVWYDASGFNNNVTTVSGTVAMSNVTSISGLGGLPYLAGNTSASMTFPNAILPSNYTLFHVTRYNGSNQKRILTSPTNTSSNWLSGHWNGLSGVSYHMNWLTQTSSNIHGSNWVLSTDQNSLYRSGQSNRTIAAPGTPSFATNIGINNISAELSDWGIASVLVYNRTLPSNQYLAIEDYLASRYSLPFPIQEGLILSLCANDFLSGATNWVDRTGLGNNFTLSSSNVFGTSGGLNCMRCAANTGFVQASNGSNTPIGTYNTFIVFAQLSNYTTDWRTLYRGVPAMGDHHLLIASGNNNLGFYSNLGAGFIPFDTNVDVSTLTNVYSKFNMWVTHHSTVPPYVQFYYNPSNLPLTQRGVIATNSNAAIRHGVAYIGSYSTIQYFGNIAQVMIYNRQLGDHELVDIFNRYKNLYGL